MHAIESLVPGFRQAIARMPGAAPAWRVLTRSAGEAALPARQAALVNLAVAQKAGGEYARWAIARLAAKQGMKAEDILLATAGTAHDPREAAIVRAAGAMATHARYTETPAYRDLTALVGAAKASALLPQVALVLLACDLLEAAAPDRRTQAPSRRGA